MSEEVIVGCSSNHHGIMYCKNCTFAFGEKDCWAYRNRYKPRLIDEEYWEKFNEPDSRRERFLNKVSQLSKSDDPE